MPSPPNPVSTYRLQLNDDLGFDAVRQLVPYLADLGVTHLYLSPIWKARPHSRHGYDICDPAVISHELGGEQGFTGLCEAAAHHSMGIVLDYVANHMCADSLYNEAWRDVLRNGPSSQFAEYFDIDWQPVKDELQNKVLLPILGHQYGTALESGELQVVHHRGDFSLRYWEQNLPLNPRQCRIILRHREEALAEVLAEEPETHQEFLSILFQLDHLPHYTDDSQAAISDRVRELNIAGQRLARLLDQSEPLQRHIDVNVQEFNGQPGSPASFDLLHELLELQPYRLSYWRTALHEINYRRFFDINELAGLRMESPQVFESAHAKVVELMHSGRVQGLRLDHIDGLYDPTSYLHQLRETVACGHPACYIVVEKILASTERLTSEWPVDGTTGYEYLNQVNRLFVKPKNLESIRRIYHSFSRRSVDFEEICYSAKQQIISTSMVSELNVLAHELNRMSEEDRRCRDFTLDSLQEALREVVACFPVYRTYISPRGVGEYDRDVVDRAINDAVVRNPAMESSIFSFIRESLCPDFAEPEGRILARRLRLAQKFQQYTSPVQAKGIEDTAFYRYCPLASLNEVGGEPAALGSPLEDFHAANAYRQASSPRSMITTSTHDTKRGEDARVRVSVLSELPEEWRKHLRIWSKIVAPARTRTGGQVAPDRNDEYLFYQSLLAIWSVPQGWNDERLQSRIHEYMSKAIKEAKTHSSWINPSNEYDNALAHFIRSLMTEQHSAAFRESFGAFADRIAYFGALNSLSQLTLKLASPGVTDFYQGTEFWDLTLVDPDNRHPVDFDTRRNWFSRWRAQADYALNENRVYDFAQIGQQPDAGELKAAITAIGLNFRRENPDLLIDGRYAPLYASGPISDHVVAFARIQGEKVLLAAVLRWFTELLGDAPYGKAAEEWHETVLPVPAQLAGKSVVNLLTNERWTCAGSIPLRALFGRIPAALVTLT
ncbi:malto-oligosyltrehalose synthase [uncultured Paludibaculum sp.]|uniref:malto-oligosyltrehalose synthase n=1 Tax=uncultured Paludibaculum sp. TaxID=1765020 RepID=UPI002AAAE7BE|nr:malto-oligosyltrehalose synthase [uncultured Paludibaculum sp.]